MELISISEHLLAFSGTGMLAMGIMNWIGDEDEPGAHNEEVSADGGDELFGDLDSGDDDFGGMDGDFGGMDDGFGDMGGGDDFGDGFGDAGGGGGNQLAQGMENRVDDLENEVAEISSTMNTVRSENEEISETVDEIEENVRKLLEIYEMVTRGVNPFVDDVQEGPEVGGSAFGGGDFGLFDDGGDNEQPEEDLDDDVMDADAESFFDDDALDEFEEEDDTDDVGISIEEDNDDETGSGASSFQELKAEYESGDAEWADGEEGDGTEADQEFELEVELEEDSGEEVVEADDEEFEFVDAVEEPPATSESTSRSDEKPYLKTLPGGYIVDLVVMEWLEFLIEEFGAQEAVRTIEYYERIEWVSETVSEQLLAYLEGIADFEHEKTGDLGPIELGIDDHIQSLTFISQLTGNSMQQKIVDHCAQIRGEGHGIQR